MHAKLTTLLANKYTVLSQLDALLFFSVVYGTWSSIETLVSPLKDIPLVVARINIEKKKKTLKITDCTFKFHISLILYFGAKKVGNTKKAQHFSLGIKQWVFSGGGMIQEKLEETHAYMGRTCKMPQRQ